MNHTPSAKNPSSSPTKAGTALSVAKAAGESTANGLNAVTQLVARNDQAIASGAQKATQATGAMLSSAGNGLAVGGLAAAQLAFSQSGAAGKAVSRAITGDSRSLLRKGLGGLVGMATNLTLKTAGAAAGVVGVAGMGISVAGRGVKQVAPGLGGAIGGAAKGVATSASQTVDAALLPASSIDRLREELRQMGRRFPLASAQDLRLLRRDQLLDAVVVGGLTLFQLLQDPSSVPPQIEQAFATAYPGLHASGESFAEAAARLSGDELIGLVSGVKGKLFELQLVDQLNAGQLPVGWEAQIADSATQAGWDIQIVDDNGVVQEVLQAKASESADYVAQALERYPGIDVSTTTEVHAQLVALGLADQVRDSGISEAALEAAVASAAHGSGDVLSAADLLPSSLALAAVSLSVFVRQDLSLQEKGAAIGERSARAGVYGYLGQATLTATQTWWIGLVAGVGSSWLAARGGHKREQYEALHAAVDAMRRVQERRPQVTLVPSV